MMPGVIYEVAHRALSNSPSPILPLPPILDGNPWRQPPYSAHLGSTPRGGTSRTKYSGEVRQKSGGGDCIRCRDNPPRYDEIATIGGRTSARTDRILGG